MNVITRGVRNAFRNGIRTFSIVVILGLSVGLALTMLIARQAVQSKIDSVKGSIGNIITVSPAGARGFQGGGEPLTEAQISKVKATPHVVSVTETLQDRLASTDTNLVSAIDPGTLGRRFGGGGNGGGGARFGGGDTGAPPTIPVFVTGTNNLGGSVFQGGGTIKLISGKTFDAAKDANTVLVGKTLATKNNLIVGSPFQAYGATMTVSGIFDSGNSFSNNYVVMALPALQRLTQQVGAVSSATVQVDSINNLSPTVTAIESTLGTGVADVVSQQDTSAQALAPLENIKTISLYSVMGAVGAGAAIILLTMLMIVRERRREIGVLKAIGASNVKVTAQFMVEAVTLTLLGAAVGLMVGVASGSSVTKLLVTSSSNAASGGGPGGGFGRGGGRLLQLAGGGLRNVQASVGWDILLYGLGAAILIAIIGSAIPAWLIAKVRPAEVMRAE